MPTRTNQALSKTLPGTIATITLVSASTWVFAQDADRIESITVTANASQVELSEAFAGGQVARGGRAGLLGNMDYMDTPFSGTAYTSDLVIAQQSESVGDVLQNDPVVRVAKGFGNFQEVYVLRGFPVYSDDLTLNGVYGILPRQFVAAELLERIEVFRGASAFINGAAPGGSGAGGTINLVPKRAPEGGVSRLSSGVETGGHGFVAADLGRRFGQDSAFGLRANGVLRSGETAVDSQERELGVASVGFDYSGTRTRFSADLGFQDNRIDAPRPQVAPTIAAPIAPEASGNFAQPWTFTDERQLFGVVRGELDLSATARAWVGIGARSGEEANVLANPKATDAGALTAYRFDNTRDDSVTSFDLGASNTFNTAGVSHRAVVSVSSVALESRNAYAFSSFFTPFESNLYSPVATAMPAADFFVGGVLSSPRVTEDTTNRSVAIADSLTLLDDRLTATLGLRYQQIETSTFDYNTGAEQSNYDDSKLSPALGLVYRLGAQTSLYGNYAQSLQPGQIAPAQSGGNAITNAGEVLEPFTGEQLEVGAKYDGGNFGLTASLFQLSRPNALVENSRFTDSGEQLSRGIELSIFGEPAQGVRLLGGATIIDAQLSNTQGAIDQGNRPIGIAKLQANINLEWDVAALPGLTLDGRWVHTGDQQINTANTQQLQSWSRVDLGARVQFNLARPVTLRARIENVSDESYWASAGGFPGANYLILGNPRALMLSASVAL